MSALSHFVFVLFFCLSFAGFSDATSGQATYYDTGLGACGKTNSDNQHVVALSPSAFGSGSRCGKEIKVSYHGNSVTAQVEDKCPGCGNSNIDLSPSAFKTLAPLELGRINVEWNYI